MSKFLIQWEVDTTKLPDNPEEQISLYIKQLNQVKEDFKREIPLKLDWGVFVGGHAGYSVCEGTEQDIALSLLKYMPYIKFKVHPVLTVDQVLENLEKLSNP